MLTKSILFTIAFSSTFAYGQDVSGYERVYYNAPENIDESDFSLEVKNAVAQFDHCKLNLKIENKSSDYLVYNSSESSFNYSFGDKHPDVKSFMINPNDAKSKTLKASGGEKFLQKEFSLEIKGLYRIPTNGRTVAAEDFQLPASKNNFEAEKFKVVLRKYDASTKEAKAEFECTYEGDGVALVNPANLSVKAFVKKTNEEVVYANDDKKGEAEVMHKGDKIKITAVFHIPGKIVDMQFATMHIIWNDTFVETSEVLLDSKTFQFTMDEALSNEKK